MAPDSDKTVLRSRLGRKLPVTADQREVRESRPLCRNRLLIVIDAAAEPDLAAETLFLNRRLSFRRLLLVDWRREAVSQLLWSDKDREVWFFLEKNVADK